jgi:hypothetical protein
MKHWRIWGPANQCRFAGYFVRISHDEVSVSHPDAIRKILLDPLRKVRTKGHYSKAFGFLETGTDVGASIKNSRILTLYMAVMGYFQIIHRLTLGIPFIGKLGLTPSQHMFDPVRRAVTARKAIQIREQTCLNSGCCS